MAMFLGIHNLGGSVPEDKMQASWFAYKAACGKFGCKAVHVHYNTGEGRAFCLTEASTVEEVQKAHEEAQVPLVEILEVKTQE